MRYTGLLSLVALATVSALAALAGHDAARTQGSFTVDATHDAVDASPGDGVCADATGACTLRAAVMETNALPGADEISLPAGTYVLSIPGAGEDASATGDLDITDGLKITGAGASDTVLDGAGIDRVVHVLSSAGVTLVRLGIRNGKTDTVESGLTGGGINNAGDLNMTEVNVGQNVGNGGGGIYNTGEIVIANSVVEHNSSRGFAGGIWNDLQASTSITDSNVSFNTASASGGGILNNDGQLTVHRSKVNGNNAGAGGGIHGGAVSYSGVYACAVTTITESEISRNTARLGGGLSSSCELEVKGSTINGNVAEAGECTPLRGVCDAGIAGGLLSSSRATLTNSTISGNSASLGGGIYHEGFFDLGLTNVTVSANAASGAGGIFNSGGGTSPSRVVLRNTIVGAQASGQDCAGAVHLVLSGGHNLDSDGTCKLTGPGDISSADPLLGPLGDNGGPTQTHALQQSGCHGDACVFGSPAIDAGDDAHCPATDQRGLSRPVDGTGDGIAVCDIGAYEQQEGPINQCTGQCPPGPPSPSPSPVLPVALPNTGGPVTSAGLPLTALIPILPALSGAAALSWQMLRRC